MSEGCSMVWRTGCVLPRRRWSSDVQRKTDTWPSESLATKVPSGRGQTISWAAKWLRAQRTTAASRSRREATPRRLRRWRRITGVRFRLAQSHWRRLSLAISHSEWRLGRWLLDTDDHRVGPDEVFDARLAEAGFLEPPAAVGAAEVEAAGRFDQHVEAHQQAEGVLPAFVVDDRLE